MPVLPPARRGAVAAPGMVQPLSTREHEVLTLLAAGHPNRAIAEQLFITVDTVKRHISHVFEQAGRDQPHPGRGQGARPRAARLTRRPPRWEPTSFTRGSSGWPAGELPPPVRTDVGWPARPALPTVVGMFTMYADYAIDLGVDLLAIFLLAYVLYFRRHRRADLLLAYVALNIGIFVAMSLLSTVRVDIALGFGLFAILSIIRLRSSAVTQQEVAYYFVALVLGLVNGLDLDDRWLVGGDERRCCWRPCSWSTAGRCATGPGAWTSPWTWCTPTTPRWWPTWSAGWAGGCMHHEVNEVDYVRDIMVVDVRYRAGSRRT